MPYPAIAFISIVIFSLVHLLAGKTKSLSKTYQSYLLSAGGGIAIAYVFIDLLPKLAKNDTIVRFALSGIFPYFERHVYIMALAGFLLFFLVDRSHTVLQGKISWEKASFWLSLNSYALFNFMVGYAVVNKDNPDIQPLALFTFAIALHYLTIDFNLSKAHGTEYRQFGKWVLLESLFLGWLIGLWVQLSEMAVALVSAFIGGGVIMNVTCHELPEENPNSWQAFLLGSLFYTAVLLSIG